MDFSIEREINLTQQYILIFQDVNIRHNILLIDELSVDNDPSAGSPTETLLRLLLPLNDKVWETSRGIAAGEPAALPQSENLTGSFNR